MNKHAGFWRRTAAVLIDTILITILYLLVVFSLIFLTGLFSDRVPYACALFFSLFSLLQTILFPWLYFAFFESSKWQATPGKRLFSIRVVDKEGHPLTFLRATGRYFGKYLSYLLLGIGFLMIAFTKKKQGLHDLLAATLVLKKVD